MWLQSNWKLTKLNESEHDDKFSARAAVGAHEKGLDIVIEVQEKTQVQNGLQPTWLNGDNVQIAIDCEGKGLSGGNTKILAALTEHGPVAWKVLSADLHGDIPSRWSPANGIAKYVDIKVTRENNLMRYNLQIPWSELYPLAYNPAKPLRMSFFVNNNNGAGQTEYIEWGSGIAKDDPSAYGVLHLDSQHVNNK